MSRKKELFLNLFVGVFSQLVILGLGLIVPRIILVHYGSDVNGLTNSITQIFGYIALLEAGISTSAKNALYKPLHDDNREQITVILSSTRAYYRKVTKIFLLVVICISFVFPFLLKTNVDYWSVFFFILFEGLTSVVSFYFVDTSICFLNTCGKTYINSWVDLGTKILCYGIKISLAVLGLNIALIQVGFFLLSLVKVLFYKLYIKKKYSWIELKKTVDYKLPYKNSFIITEVAWTVFSSTDMIVLSLFLSTSVSSIYSVYNMVFVSLNMVLISIYNSLSYLLGKVYFEDIEKYKVLHDNFSSFIMSISTILMCVAYWLTLPFVRLYTNGIEDVNYIYEYLPFLFCLVQLLSWSRYVSGNLTSIAGYAKKVSYISLIEAISNVILSVILVQFFGIYGVVLGTLISLPVKVIYTHFLSERRILRRSPLKDIMIIGCNFLVFGGTYLLEKIFLLKIDNYFTFVLYGAGLTVIYSFVVVIVNLLVNQKLFGFIKNILKRKKIAKDTVD